MFEPLITYFQRVYLAFQELKLVFQYWLTWLIKAGTLISSMKVLSIFSRYPIRLFFSIPLLLSLVVIVINLVKTIGFYNVYRCGEVVGQKYLDEDTFFNSVSILSGPLFYWSAFCIVVGTIALISGLLLKDKNKKRKSKDFGKTILLIGVIGIIIAHIFFIINGFFGITITGSCLPKIN